MPISQFSPKIEKWPILKLFPTLELLSIIACFEIDLIFGFWILKISVNWDNAKYASLTTIRFVLILSFNQNPPREAV